MFVVIPPSPSEAGPQNYPQRPLSRSPWPIPRNPSRRRRLRTHQSELAVAMQQAVLRNALCSISITSSYWKALMYIETVGQGPALVLIHGWALHGGVFAPLVERLAGHYTLHLVDLPGHGHSRDDDTPLALPFVAGAIAAATPPAVWIGWSLGGLIALQASATLPQVRGLVMLASTARFVRGADWPHALDPQLLTQFGQDLEQDYHATVERFLALDLLGHAAASEQMQAIRQALSARGQPSPRSLQQALAVLHGSDLRRALPTLRQPSLWLGGQRDRLVSAQSMQSAAAMAPDAEFSSIGQSGHAPFLSQPDLVATAVQRYVSTLDAG